MGGRPCCEKDVKGSKEGESTSNAGASNFDRCVGGGGEDASVYIPPIGSSTF